MKKTNTIRVLAILGGLLGLIAATDQALLFAHSPHGKSGKKTSALAYHDTWRKLWEDQITWTRMVILGVFDNLPGAGTYQARLIENYEDMEDALRPYYGEDAEELGDLIQDHLVIAVEILNAAKSADAAGLEDAKVRWYRNGADIANLMAVRNPKYWKLGEAEKMWRDHLNATLEEAAAHLANDFAGDVAAYDKVHLLAVGMADFFSQGVLRQFKREFSAP